MGKGTKTKYQTKTKKTNKANIKKSKSNGKGKK